uniref:Uncharacterized protein n=1 Tax=Pristionchus pacificus TaxID=54126 RepID=A0A2A6BHL2_PRIPA|eukprot:PDM65382.1 hypothetical protein PRIPAC_52324 [Pristionchus pacificus]
MDVHEGTEILARLGILESKEESPSRKKDDSFVDVKFADSDSDSGADVVFDRVECAHVLPIASSWESTESCSLLHLRRIVHLRHIYYLLRALHHGTFFSFCATC